MKVRKKSVFDFSSFCKSKEFYFDEIIKSKDAWKIVGKFVIILIALTFSYGFVMGIYQNLLQAIAAGIKVTILFMGATLVCFPSFFIIQLILGSQLKLSQMLGMILIGFLLMMIIMVSFSPIVIFFIITGGQYHFVQLLHVVIYVFSGIFGMWIILSGLKYSCESKGIYPRIGVTILRIWIIILAFVSIQLAWNLRPFMGKKNEKFTWSRKYEGNFYTAIIYSIDQLAERNQMKQYEKRRKDATPTLKSPGYESDE